MLMVTEPSVITQVHSHGRVLHSWKEIASYMGRGVRTIQRYEARLGLPVRRPSGAPRSAVLAFSDEIDQWLAKSPTKVESVIEVERLVETQKEPVSNARFLTVETVYRKALMGQQRADDVQKRVEAMQTLVAQMKMRLQTSVERRNETRTRLTANRLVIQSLHKLGGGEI